MVGVHGSSNVDSTWLNRVKSTQTQQLFSQTQLCVNIDFSPGKEQNATDKLAWMWASLCNTALHIHSLVAEFTIKLSNLSQGNGKVVVVSFP